MDSPPYVTVARVVTTHGIAGELSVAPMSTYDLGELVGQDVWLAPPVRLARPRRVIGLRPGPKGPLVTLDGIEDPERAAEAIGCTLLVPPGTVPREFLQPEWSADGYRVADSERGDLGEVVETIVTGANDVWVARGPLGEVLIPVIDDVVVRVDDETRQIHVELLPGLLEDES